MKANLIPGQENITFIGSEIAVKYLPKQEFLGIAEKSDYDEKIVNNNKLGVLVLGYGKIIKINKKSSTVEIEMIKKNKIKKELFFQ